MAYELRKYYGIDVALIIHQSSQYITYRLMDLESFPPAMKETVGVYLFFIDLSMLTSTQQVLYPVPKNILPQNIENQLQSFKKQAHDK
jgi:hypothetical protein